MPALRHTQIHRAVIFSSNLVIIWLLKHIGEAILGSSVHRTHCCLKKQRDTAINCRYLYSNLKMNGGSKMSIFFWCYHLLRCFGGLERHSPSYDMSSGLSRPFSHDSKGPLTMDTEVAKFFKMLSAYLMTA